MSKHRFTVLMIGMALCASLNSVVAAQAAKPTLEQRYEEGIRGCEWAHKSRSSSRNYQSGKTKAEVDAKYQSCLADVKKQYETAVQQRTQRAAGN